MGLIQNKIIFNKKGKNMLEVKILEHTKLSNAVIAARTCWGSFHKGGNYESPTDDISNDDKELLDRLIKKSKHESIIEHVVYCVSIKGLPRFVLQELARHRIASYSVRSTRYTLKELRDESEFVIGDKDSISRSSKYIELFSDNDEQIIRNQIIALEALRLEIKSGRSIDECKFLLPEAYKCDLVWTINARSLINFLTLRRGKSAHFKIRELAEAIYEALPESHKFIYSETTQS